MTWNNIFFKILTVVLNGLTKKFPEIFTEVKAWWVGKTIAIIGPTASGKNSMFSRLQKNPIPAEHIQTRGAEKISNFKVFWPLPDGSTVDFNCKRSINVGGEIDERERYWLQTCKGADVIFYLLDAEKLQANESETLARFRDDMRWIVTNFRNFQPSVAIHILLNKIDVSLGKDPQSISAPNSINKLIDTIENEAKSTLEGYFKRVTGLTPISMSDEHLFNKYFAETLNVIPQIKSSESNEK